MSACVAFAQAEKSIIIDASKFRPVQTDALTGVNIDPIGLDYSKRPCARLKIKINRMTVEEIDGIEVKVATNNAVMRCQTAQYDTGLIVEMTAKPNTRFYFHHNEYGDSIEVCLNLEPNKEYYLEAYLNQTFSIVVNSNVAEADIYNDGTKKGVVFEVTADGRSGKIVSMTRSANLWKWSLDESERKRLIGADSETDGAYNMAKVKAVSGWQKKYPAFKWCADLGEGWYLPSIEELKKFALDDATRKAVNRTLAIKGGIKLYNRGKENKWYWSSTEYNKQYIGEFCAWGVNMYDGGTDSTYKGDFNYLRAVAKF